MQMTTLGIDVAKHLFQLHGVDTHGNVVLTKRLSRAKVLPFIAQLPRLCRKFSCVDDVR
jgi:transposase